MPDGLLIFASIRMKTFFKKYINNKYFYTGLAFVIWMIFFDQESFIDRYHLNQTLKDLENQKAFYLDEINKTSIKSITLTVKTSLNISLDYFDKNNGSTIPSANVTIVDFGHGDILLEYTNGICQTELDTGLLGIGINTITIIDYNYI